MSIIVFTVGGLVILNGASILLKLAPALIAIARVPYVRNEELAAECFWGGFFMGFFSIGIVLGGVSLAGWMTLSLQLQKLLYVMNIVSGIPNFVGGTESVKKCWASDE